MEPLRNLLLAGLGALSASQEKLSKVVGQLIDSGELTREQGEKVVDEWVDRGREEQGKIADRVSAEIQKVVEKLALVSRDEYDQLQARVKELESKLGE